MLKKKIVLFLAATMLVSGVSYVDIFASTESKVIAQAAEMSVDTVKEGNFEYSINEDGTATVTRCLSQQNKEIRIPSEVEKEGESIKLPK